MDLHENMVLRFSEYIDSSHVTYVTLNEISEIIIANVIKFEKPQLASKIYHHIATMLNNTTSIVVFVEIDLEPVRIRLSFEDGTKFRFTFNGSVPEYRFRKVVITK